MTLSGNLGFVPLDEVLRLLTRAGNDGVVQITNSAARGRIFVQGTGISLATTLTDFELKEHLGSSGYISTEDLEAVDGGGKSLGDFFTEETEGLALLREMTVESIYQLDSKDADFQVLQDETSPYASPTAFDLEKVLIDSRDRRDQWETVRKTITDLNSPLTINRELDRDSVELKKDAWRLIAEIGTGTSVSDLAKNLGTTDFAVAKVAADMVQTGLVSIVKADADTQQPTTYDDSDYKSDYESAQASEFHAAAPVVAETVEEPADVSADVHSKSWWDEPEAEDSVEQTEDESADVKEFQPVTADFGSDYEGTDEVSVGETAIGTSDDDTEAFLEKVFSDIGEQSESADDGHGLMRRRRMGSILRELGED